jgi:hypothetical protein
MEEEFYEQLIPEKSKKRIMRFSQVFWNYRELDNIWNTIKKLRIADDLDYPPSVEESDRLSDSIRKAKELITILAFDLENWLNLLMPNEPGIQRRLQLLKKWKNEILQEISKRSYIDKNQDNWQIYFEEVNDLLSFCFFQIFGLVDCLELPKEHKKALRKVLWERFIGFCIGVLSSVIAFFIIKLFF